MPRPGTGPRSCGWETLVYGNFVTTIHKSVTTVWPGCGVKACRFHLGHTGGGRYNIWDSTSSMERKIMRYVISWRTFSDCRLYHQRKSATALLLSLQSNLGSRTPRIMISSVYEQIFRTQSVSGDVLCLELRTRKPSTSWSDKLGGSASAVFVEEWSSGKNPESATPIGPVGLKQSRVVPRDRKKEKNPPPNNNISLPHHLPLTPSALLHTGTVKLN
jgi:hypothetical protein